jgi:putative exporter of polyketide antibiotics
MKNKLIAFLLSMGIFVGAQAQSSTTDDSMASLMRSNGKIYVVVAVVLTILFGLIGYLIRLDKKISKLEKGS